jgi:diacylglycerol kinase (ATP)
LQRAKKVNQPTTSMDTPQEDATTTVARPIVVIINANSRRGRAQFEEALDALRSVGLVNLEPHAVKSTDETRHLLEREIEAGAKMVIVGGGDGTLSECAGLLVHTSVAMGVLPMGTGNTLSRSLGLPLDLPGAAKAMAEGHVQLADVGVVNGRVFLNSVTLGLSSEIAHALDKETKKRLGLFAWPYIGIRVFLRHRALVLRITSPEKSYNVRTHQLVVANGRYIAGPVAASPTASIQDNILDIFVLGGADKGSLIRTALNWVRGRHITDKEARYFKAHSVRVESLRGSVPADVDGEIYDGTPLEIEVKPRALRMIVPAGYVADQV